MPLRDETVVTGATVGELLITRHGGPEVLQVRSRDLPPPGRGEVRVEVEAAAACYTDMLIRRGRYPGVRTPPPFVVGYDYVGRVDALGAGVTRWKVGDRGRPVVVLTYLTAYQALTCEGRAAPGDAVLVIGASRRGRAAALDAGRALGLQITGVTSQANAGEVSELGAEPIAYGDPEYRQHERRPRRRPAASP